MLSLLFLFIVSVNVHAQTTVTGKVTAGDSALSGVSVLVKGTTNGTVTDASGAFSIAAPAGGTLVFSYAGFSTKEVALTGQTSLNVDLSAKANDLSEVIVVAYGNTTRRTFTGSLQTVKADELADLPVAQFTQKLQGRLAGVQIQQTTGVPGAGMSVRIRGAASIGGGTQPLYVVDGYPITGDIANINPDEIETFTVLKDASATALYGSRAANGVVVITTKRAKGAQSSLSFNAYYGVQQVPQKGRPDMMNAEEFAQYENEVFQEKIRLGQVTSIPAEYQNPAQYRGGGTDWYGILLRDAPIQSYTVSMASAATGKLSSAAVFGYLNQDGVLLNSNFKRYSLRLNSDYKFNDRLTIGFNLAPAYTTTSTPNSDGNIFGGGIIQSAIATSPIAPYKNADGSLPLTATSAGLFPNPNWYRVVQEVKNNTRTFRILSNAYLTLDIIRNLQFRTSINVDATSQRFNNFTPSTAGSLFSAPPIQTNARENKGSNYSWLTENTLNFKHTIGEHNFDALAGYTAQRYYGESSSVFASGFPNDRVQTLNAGSTFSPGFSVSEWTLASFVSRLNYSYKNRYLLSASFRRDGSSRFAPNTKYGNFPSVSVGWNVSEESFLATNKKISFLKIRAGYGLNGNFNIGDYSYLARTATSNYTFNNSLAQGTTVASIGNSNLSWEKSKQLDIGLDLGLFNDRLFFTYDYFHKTTSGMLFNVGVPQQSGFGSVTDNVGEFDFKGHEFLVSSKNIVSRGFTWSTDFNISFIRNKVVNLGPYPMNLPRGDANGPNITMVGQPLGSFFGYQFIGVYMNQDDFNKSPKYVGGSNTSEVGTVKYADGAISRRFRTVSAIPEGVGRPSSM